MKSIKISNKRIMYWGIEILLLLTILPVTQCFPRVFRWGLQVMSILFFLIGLSLERKKNYILGYIACVAFALMYVYNVWKFNQSIVTCIFNVMAGFAFAFYGIIALSAENHNHIFFRKAVNTTVILFCLTAITTIIGLQKYPLAVRELGRVGSGYSTSGQAFLDLKFKYKLMNIASWSMAYGMVFVVPWLMNRYKHTKKIKFLFGFLIILFCLLKAQLTIGIIVTALLIILSLYKPGTNNNDIIILSFIVILCFLSLIFRNELLALIISVLDNCGLGMLSIKLRDLSYLLQGSQIGDISARFERYSRSLKWFLEKPMFGFALTGVPEYGMFGNHSDFFDMIGYYGVFGCIILTVIVCRYYKRINRSSNIIKWEALVSAFGLLLIFILNPIWYSPQVFATAIMLPCCSHINSLKKFR